MPSLDLSHPIADGMPVYPDTTPVEIERTMTVADDGVLASVLTLQSHAGTHIDAPCHMRAGAPALSDFEIEDFQFDAHLVDCTHRDAREAITVDALPDAEVAEAVDLLAFATGWDVHWGTARYRDHPALSAATAAWCAEHDCAVGIDAFSPDPTPSAGAPDDASGHRDAATESAEDDAAAGDDITESEDTVESTGYPAHDALFAADQFIVENLTGLTALPDTFRLHAYPLPIVDGDASPIRAVAEY